MDKSDNGRIVLDAIAYTAQLFTDLHDRVQTYAEMLRIVDPAAASSSPIGWTCRPVRGSWSGQSPPPYGCT